jgi:hypothetical protein
VPIINTMAVTRLERKGRRNVSKAKRAKQVIKSLNAKPVIKNVDVEEVKKEFAKKTTKK